MNDKFDLSDFPIEDEPTALAYTEDWDEPTQVADRAPVTSDETWDLRFLEIARTVASWSKDPKRRVGAVIVDWRREIVAMGYNGFPRQVDDDPVALADSETKNAFTIHAEVNACLKLRATGPGELTMYCTSMPCASCMAVVIQAGITTVVCPDDRRADSKWARSWDHAMDLARRAGVAVVFETTVLNLARISR